MFQFFFEFPVGVNTHLRQKHQIDYEEGSNDPKYWKNTKFIEQLNSTDVQATIDSYIEMANSDARFFSSIENLVAINTLLHISLNEAQVLNDAIKTHVELLVSDGCHHDEVSRQKYLDYQIETKRVLRNLNRLYSLHFGGANDDGQPNFFFLSKGIKFELRNPLAQNPFLIELMFNTDDTEIDFLIINFIQNINCFQDACKNSGRFETGSKVQYDAIFNFYNQGMYMNESVGGKGNLSYLLKDNLGFQSYQAWIAQLNENDLQTRDQEAPEGFEFKDDLRITNSTALLRTEINAVNQFYPNYHPQSLAKKILQEKNINTKDKKNQESRFYYQLVMHLKMIKSITNPVNRAWVVLTALLCDELPKLDDNIEISQNIVHDIFQNQGLLFFRDNLTEDQNVYLRKHLASSINKQWVTKEIIQRQFVSAILNQQSLDGSLILQPETSLFNRIHDRFIKPFINQTNEAQSFELLFSQNQLNLDQCALNLLTTEASFFIGIGEEMENIINILNLSQLLEIPELKKSVDQLTGMILDLYQAIGYGIVLLYEQGLVKQAQQLVLIFNRIMIIPDLSENIYNLPATIIHSVNMMCVLFFCAFPSWESNFYFLRFISNTPEYKFHIQNTIFTEVDPLVLTIYIPKLFKYNPQTMGSIVDVAYSSLLLIQQSQRNVSLDPWFALFHKLETEWILKTLPLPQLLKLMALIQKSFDSPWANHNNRLHTQIPKLSLCFNQITDSIQGTLNQLDKEESQILTRLECFFKEKQYLDFYLENLDPAYVKLQMQTAGDMVISKVKERIILHFNIQQQEREQCYCFTFRNDSNRPDFEQVINFHRLSLVQIYDMQRAHIGYIYEEAYLGILEYYSNTRFPVPADEVNKVLTLILNNTKKQGWAKDSRLFTLRRLKLQLEDKGKQDLTETKLDGIILQVLIQILQQNTREISKLLQFIDDKPISTQRNYFYRLEKVLILGRSLEQNLEQIQQQFSFQTTHYVLEFLDDLLKIHPEVDLSVQESLALYQLILQIYLKSYIASVEQQIKVKQLQDQWGEPQCDPDFGGIPKAGNLRKFYDIQTIPKTKSLTHHSNKILFHIVRRGTSNINQLVQEFVQVVKYEMKELNSSLKQLICDLDPRSINANIICWFLLIQDIQKMLKITIPKVQKEFPKNSQNFITNFLEIHLQLSNLENLFIKRQLLMVKLRDSRVIVFKPDLEFQKRHQRVNKYQWVNQNYLQAISFEMRKIFQFQEFMITFKHIANRMFTSSPAIIAQYAYVEYRDAFLRMILKKRSGETVIDQIKDKVINMIEKEQIFKSKLMMNVDDLNSSVELIEVYLTQMKKQNIEVSNELGYEFSQQELEKLLTDQQRSVERCTTMCNTMVYWNQVMTHSLIGIINGLIDSRQPVRINSQVIKNISQINHILSLTIPMVLRYRRIKTLNDEVNQYLQLFSYNVERYIWLVHNGDQMSATPNLFANLTFKFSSEERAYHEISIWKTMREITKSESTPIFGEKLLLAIKYSRSKCVVDIQRYSINLYQWFRVHLFLVKLALAQQQNEVTNQQLREDCLGIVSLLCNALQTITIDVDTHLLASQCSKLLKSFTDTTDIPYSTEDFKTILNLLLGVQITQRKGMELFQDEKIILSCGFIILELFHSIVKETIDPNVYTAIQSNMVQHHLKLNSITLNSKHKKTTIKDLAQKMVKFTDKLKIGEMVMNYFKSDTSVSFECITQPSPIINVRYEPWEGLFQTFVDFLQRQINNVLVQRQQLESNFPQHKSDTISYSIMTFDDFFSLFLNIIDHYSIFALQMLDHEVVLDGTLKEIYSPVFKRITFLDLITIASTITGHNTSFQQRLLSRIKYSEKTLGSLVEHLQNQLILVLKRFQSSSELQLHEYEILSIYSQAIQQWVAESNYRSLSRRLLDALHAYLEQITPFKYQTSRALKIFDLVNLLQEVFILSSSQLSDYRLRNEQTSAWLHRNINIHVGTFCRDRQKYTDMSTQSQTIESEEQQAGSQYVDIESLAQHKQVHGLPNQKEMELRANEADELSQSLKRVPPTYKQYEITQSQNVLIKTLSGSKLKSYPQSFLPVFGTEAGQIMLPDQKQTKNSREKIMVHEQYKQTKTIKVNTHEQRSSNSTVQTTLDGIFFNNDALKKQKEKDKQPPPNKPAEPARQLPTFNFEDHGYPNDAIKLYGIDEDQFIEAKSEEMRNYLIYDYKKRFDSKSYALKMLQMIEPFEVEFVSLMYQRDPNQCKVMLEQFYEHYFKGEGSSPSLKFWFSQLPGSMRFGLERMIVDPKMQTALQNYIKVENPQKSTFTSIYVERIKQKLSTIKYDEKYGQQPYKLQPDWKDERSRFFSQNFESSDEQFETNIAGPKSDLLDIKVFLQLPVYSKQMILNMIEAEPSVLLLDLWNPINQYTFIEIVLQELQLIGQNNKSTLRPSNDDFTGLSVNVQLQITYSLIELLSSIIRSKSANYMLFVEFGGRAKLNIFEILGQIIELFHSTREESFIRKLFKTPITKALEKSLNTKSTILERIQTILQNLVQAPKDESEYQLMAGYRRQYPSVVLTPLQYKQVERMLIKLQTLEKLSQVVHMIEYNSYTDGLLGIQNIINEQTKVLVPCLLHLHRSIETFAIQCLQTKSKSPNDRFEGLFQRNIQDFCAKYSQIFTEMVKFYEFLKESIDRILKKYGQQLFEESRRSENFLGNNNTILFIYSWACQHKSDIYQKLIEVPNSPLAVYMKLQSDIFILLSQVNAKESKIVHVLKPLIKIYALQCASPKIENTTELKQLPLQRILTKEDHETLKIDDHISDDFITQTRLKICFQAPTLIEYLTEVTKKKYIITFCLGFKQIQIPFVSQIDLIRKQIIGRLQSSRSLVHIQRTQIWYDTCQQFLHDLKLQNVSKMNPKIRFAAEKGIDAGGLTSEWITLLTKELLNPDLCLFQLSTNKVTFQPHPQSYIVPNHLYHFKMFGKLIGFCLLRNIDIEVDLTLSFLKHFTHEPLYISDLEDIDPELSKSLMHLLDIPVEDLYLTYTHNERVFGEFRNVDLGKGYDHPVTDENKKDYIKAVANYKMTGQISDQIEAFRDGLEQMIPREFLQQLKAKNLALKLSGSKIINVAQIKENIGLQGFDKQSPQVKWFFEVIEEMPQELRAKLLFFITGSFKVPYNGFGQSEITLCKVKNPDQLPVSHTCSKELEMPEYSSKNILRDKLLIAIEEGNQGFYIG